MVERSKIIQLLQHNKLDARASSFQQSIVCEKFCLLFSKESDKRSGFALSKSAKHLSNMIGLIVVYLT